MDITNKKKNMTIDDLAVMVAAGFNDVTSRMATKEDLKVLADKVDGIDHRLEAYNSNVKNYLNLAEKRYAELKQRDALLAQWIKLVADKLKVPVDLSQLEKI